MRRWFFAIAATLFAAVAMTPAGALPLGPAAMRPTRPLTRSSRPHAGGLRGWGWYPCWGWYSSPYYYHHWRHLYWQR